ncbi:endonuclease/exonuclease/phosphatase family protein [Streptomyces sp. CA-243310]|uniref:endonuclease/exonuclease/phosphatase family protein n=1 Tax=Streptomyces sp. CA-243310 TaxID=3240056 RepID=UPI003D8B6F0C
MIHRARKTLAALAALAALAFMGVGASAYATQSAETADGENTMPYAVEDFPPSLQVLSWNMCGPQRATWNCSGTGTPEDKVGVITRQVAVNRVEAALLQEVCEDDLTLLMSRLGTGWNKTFAPYQWSQEGKKSNSRCGEDTGRADRIGTAIVVKGQISDANTYPLTQPTTGLQSPFQCATATASNTRLCSVHASRRGVNPDHPDWDYRDDQLAEIKAVVNGHPRVVFGGDFNALPPHDPDNTTAWVWPAGLYPNAAGAPGYEECDQNNATGTTRPTHASGAKIDYIFTSLPKNWCTVTTTPHSDHRVLIESIKTS